MSMILYATTLLLLVSFVVFVRQASRAPEGHEDEMGFHLGTPSAQPAARRATPVRRTATNPSYPRVPSTHLAA